MKRHFTESAEKALLSAEKQAGLFGHTYIGSEHLLLGLLANEESTAARILAAKGLVHRRLAEAVSEYAGLGAESAPKASDMTPTLRRIIENAKQKTALDGAPSVGSEHLLLALLEEGESVAVRIILRENVSVAEMRGELSSFLTAGRAEEGRERGKSAPPSALPHLTAYGKDMTLLAEEGKLDPVIGREEETARCIRILSRKNKNNPCLLGDPGVGKTAVVEGLAQAIANGRVPEDLKRTRLFSLDLAAMIAGAKYRGEFEERMRGVLDELRSHPEILLFIDEIHILNGAGAAEGAIDAASILKPALARGEIRLIGATTREEYRRHIEKDAALERRFQPIDLAEPSTEEAIAILRGLRLRYEAHHKIRITDAALVAAVKLSVRYLPERFLPDKALDLLDEAAAEKKILSDAHPPSLNRLRESLNAAEKRREAAILTGDQKAAVAARIEENRLRDSLAREKAHCEETSRKAPPLLTEEDIRRVTSAISGIPIPDKGNTGNASMLRIEETLSARVLGQKVAVSAVASALRRRAAGLSDPHRPTGSFLFLGPTGVGKTALAEAIAELLFPEGDAAIRFDMSEYMEAASVAKLIGAAPGYVGHGEGGRLTLAVRRRPYSLVLFDEIEKAHPDVLNLLLQILDCGVLTDAEGKKTDFRNTVVVMTSNLMPKGTHTIGFSQSESQEPLRRHLEASLSSFFRVELLNRMDEIVLFEELTDEDMDKIADFMLKQLSEKAKENGLFIRFSSGVSRRLSRVAAEEKSGARPLRRLIEAEVEAELSALLLRGEKEVLVTVENDHLVFTPEPEAAHPYLSIEGEIEA